MSDEITSEITNVEPELSNSSPKFMLVWKRALGSTAMEQLVVPDDVDYTNVSKWFEKLDHADCYEYMVIFTDKIEKYQIIRPPVAHLT